VVRGPGAPFRLGLSRLRPFKSRPEGSARGKTGRNPGQAAGGEGSVGAEHHEGAGYSWTPVHTYPQQQGDESPVAGRPGCLLFLRREESLEVTSGGHSALRRVRLFASERPEGVTP